jgi:DNA-binding PadR family transcriptional regulator
VTGISEYLPLHSLEFEILMVLLEGPSHAYAIVQRLERDSTLRQKILPANLYRRVRDLMDRSLIEECPRRESGLARGRRDFRISALGRRVVRAEAQRLDQLLTTARRHGLVQGT